MIVKQLGESLSGHLNQDCLFLPLGVQEVEQVPLINALMGGTIIGRTTVRVLIAGLAVVEIWIVEHGCANAVHALLILITNSGGVITRYFIEKFNLAGSVTTGIAGTPVVMILSGFWVETTNRFLDHLHDLTLLEEFLSALLFLKFKVERRADEVLSLMKSLLAFALHTPEALTALDCIASVVILDASAMEAAEAVFAFYIHALPDIGRDISFLFGSKGPDVFFFSLVEAVLLSQESGCQDEDKQNGKNGLSHRNYNYKRDILFQQSIEAICSIIISMQNFFIQGQLKYEKWMF